MRAGIPIWYTQGFNPHAKMVFALPLPVGVESVCEYLDVKIDKEIPCDDVKELLNKQLTEELQVIEVYNPTTKFADISKAYYRILLESISASHELAKKINDFFLENDFFCQLKKNFLYVLCIIKFNCSSLGGND